MEWINEYGHLLDIIWGKKSTVVFTSLTVACRTHSTLNTDSPLHGELPLGSFPGVFQPLNLQVAMSNTQSYTTGIEHSNATLTQVQWFRNNENTSVKTHFFLQFPGLRVWAEDFLDQPAGASPVLWSKLASLAKSKEIARAHNLTRTGTGTHKQQAS